MRHLFLAASATLAVLAGAPALAADAAAMAGFAPVVVGDAATRGLRAQLGYTRLTGWNTVDGLWAGGTTGVTKLLAPRGPGDGELFAQSLGHSTEAVVRRGDRALSGWRDPLTDTWLLAEWRRVPADGTAWQLVRTTLALTQDLAPGGAAEPAPLLPRVTEIGVPGALALAHRDAVAAFRRAGAGDLDALPWDGKKGSDARAERAREVALLRLDAARVARGELERSAPGAAGLVNVALVEETPAVRAVSDGIARNLAALPTEVRLSLRIVAALPARDRVLALVQSPLQPSSLWVAHLQGAGEAARVTNVESIDLAKAE